MSNTNPVQLPAAELAVLEAAYLKQFGRPMPEHLKVESVYEDSFLG